MPLAVKVTSPHGPLDGGAAADGVGSSSWQEENINGKQSNVNSNFLIVVYI